MRYKNLNMLWVTLLTGIVLPGFGPARRWIRGESSAGLLASGSGLLAVGSGLLAAAKRIKSLHAVRCRPRNLYLGTVHSHGPWVRPMNMTICFYGRLYC